MSIPTKFIFLSLFFFGCSTLAYRSPGPYHGENLLGEGTYSQEVRVEGDSGSYRFKGIFQRKASSVLYTALHENGQKVFRVHDSLSPGAEPSIQIFPSSLEAYAKDLRAIYLGFRPLLLLRDSPRDPSVRARYPDERPRTLAAPAGIQLTIEEYGWDGHAEKLSVSGPGFTARILQREYKAEN